jgi:iron complex outermembrane receptor protein
VGYSNQVKTIKIKPNQNDLNVTLEPTVFEMDAVIVSTAFNKIQSQNVMKVEHKTKELQQKGTATLIEGLATIPFSSFYWNIDRNQ